MWDWRIVVGALTLAAAGCGSESGSQPAPVKQTASTTGSGELKRYAAGDLPQVLEPLPPLDNGRVLLSPPSGWRLLPRDPKYLVRLVQGPDDNSLPRITVTAEPAPDNLPDVTEESAAQFAASMEKQSAAVPGRKLLEPERPIVVGDIVWSRHVRQLRTRSGSRVAATQSLTTVRAGRLYSIELSVDSPGESAAEMAKAVLDYRDAAYALAANWKFTDEAAEPTPMPPELPAESNPPAGEGAEKDPVERDASEKNPD